MEVVPAAEGFTPESIGKAMAQSWHVNGLTLQLIQVVDDRGLCTECPITHEPMTNIGMTAVWADLRNRSARIIHRSA